MTEESRFYKREYRYKDADPEYQDDQWDDHYVVLYNADKLVINADEAGHSIAVYEGEVDRYIAILSEYKRYLNERATTKSTIK